MKTRIYILLLSFAFPAYAQLDSASQEALQQTQDLLRNKSEREKSIQSDSAAQNVDAHVKKMFGESSGATEGIYDLAADIFADLVKQSNGDVDTMNKLIEEYQRDPAAYAEKWSPEQKAKLKELSKKVKVPASKP